jgi:hypothetical protein
MGRLAQCKAALAGAESRVKWHEYGGWESSVPRGIEPMDYVQVLSDMDFCLSPPGWDWYTHRTVEALVRGSIPVIEDPQVYGLDLADGENCIVAGIGVPPCDALWNSPRQTSCDLGKTLWRSGRNDCSLRRPVTASGRSCGLSACDLTDG